MIPLPQIVQDDLNRQLHTASFMGIIPEINRAWVTIDSKIIFWNYLSPNEVDRYDGLRDIILSVSISAPKPGVFLDSVKYVLVVATTVEVVLMAVSWDDAAGDLKIIPTTYSISTDSVPMLKVTGTQSGRVFMGGQDGNLYELTYENAENKWASLVGMDGTSHKCQKVNHNAWSLTAVLPPFLRSILSAEQSIVDIVSDDVRRLLYIVTSSNGLRLVYTGPDGKSTSLVVSNFDLEHAVRLFLNSTGKHLDTIPRPDFFQDADSFQIVNLFVVPVTESKSVHAVLSLRSGTRIYLQLSTWSELTRAFGPYNHTHGNKNVSDARLDVAFVRGPPTAEAFTDCRQKGKVNRDGYLPANSLANVREQKVTLSSSYYSHGVFLAALKNQDALLPDELYGVGDDCTNRRSSIPVGPSSAGVLYEQPVAGLRESLCPVNIMDGRVVADYKVFDIKESCRQIHSRNQAPLWTLSLASGTPVAKEVQGKSSFKPFQAGNKLDTPSFTPLTYSTALAAAGHADVTGVSVQNASFVLPLSEFTTQALPLLTQRQFLCLTRFGMLVVKKRRPLDYLVKCLLTNDGNLDNQAYFEKIDGFFKYYGHVESLCMCLELMCDVPLDKLGSTGLESLQLPPSDVRSLRERLRAIVYRMGGCAGFETLGRNGATDTSRDNRLSTGTIAPNFFFSHRYDAFSIVLGRVLRPVWLKPLVDNRQLSPIWSTWVLTTIRRVSEQLRHCIAEFYPLAVKNDFFSPERVDENGRNVHTAGVNSGLITDRLFLQQHLTQDPNKRFQAEAIEREDTSMSAFWRVLCRSHQALTLVHLLVVIENVHKVKVNWSELGDVSFRTFVVSPSVHDKAKRMLHGVVTSILKNGDKRMEAVADEFTQKLTEDCYLYFSAGDRYAYEVSKHVDAMRAQQRENPMGVPRGLLQSQTDGLLYLLLKACKFWVSLEDVRDEDGKESLLSTYCRMLKELGAVGKMGIVRLCLATATNFGASMSTGEEAALIRRDEDIDGASNDWDRAMYHVGSVLSDDARKEALEACQNCLLRHLEETLRLDQLLPSTAADSLAAERMVDTLMEGTSDPVLRRKVFEVLLRENVDEILHLRSPDVQQFLLEEDYRYNYECLYKYLEFHGMYRDAANYMCNLAHTETPTHVEQRIRFLRLGVDSASRAAEEVPRLTSYSAGQRDRRAEGAGSDAEFLSELQDELLVRGTSILS